MKPGGGRQKGASFELHCCRLLTGWYGGEFKRVPMSGGWDKSVITGDIFRAAPNGGVDTKFPLSIECKCQEKWEIEEVLRGVGKVFKWWKQCVDDCPRTKHPFLIFTRNGKQIYVMYRYTFHVDFIEVHTTYPTLYIPSGKIQLWPDFARSFLPKIPIKELSQLKF